MIIEWIVTSVLIVALCVASYAIGFWEGKKIGEYRPISVDQFTALTKGRGFPRSRR